MTESSPGNGSSTLRSAGFELSASEIWSDALGLRSQIPDGAVAGLCTDDAVVVAAALAALNGWATEVRLFPADMAPTAGDAAEMVLVDVETLAVIADAAPVVTPPNDSARRVTRWVLHTSGTTGAPKAIAHTMESLARTIVASHTEPRVWGLLYDPTRMAGIQVILQAISSGASLVAPSLGDGLSTRVVALVDAGVDSLSATPTLWRQILQVPASAGWPLRQITLGGEIADQRILDALASAYPAARIVHVFASTETGAAFSVRDGREGFPLDYLESAAREIRLEIRDDILHVFSPGVSVAEADGFASTGDIVEVRDDRVLFRGRASGVVNVGGSNVWPEVVESILREHPDVVEAVVTAKPNPMTGNVLMARVELTADAEVDGVTKRLRSFVRGRAPGTHVPASISVDDHIEVASTGKVTR